MERYPSLPEGSLAQAAPRWGLALLQGGSQSGAGAASHGPSKQAAQAPQPLTLPRPWEHLLRWEGQGVVLSALCLTGQLVQAVTILLTSRDLQCQLGWKRQGDLPPCV